MQKEKVRVYELARELDRESSELLQVCRQLGFDVKNQLSSLNAEQRAAVEQMVKGSGGGVAAPPTPKPSIPVTEPLSGKVRVLAQRQPRREPDLVKTPPAAGVVAVPPVVIATPIPAVVEPRAAPPAAAHAAPPAAVHVAPPAAVHVTPPAAAHAAPPAAKVIDTPPLEPPVARPPEIAAVAGDSGDKAPASLGGSKMRDLSQQPRTDSGQRDRRTRGVPRPAVVRVASPPPLKQRPHRDEKKSAEPAAQKPLQRLTPEQMQKHSSGEKPIDAKALLNKTLTVDLVLPPGEILDEDDDGTGAKPRPGQVVGRDSRHKERAARTKLRKGRDGEADVKRVSTALLDEPERPQKTKDRLIRIKKKQREGTQPRKGKVPVEVPITVRSLSEALGVKSGDLLFRLKDHAELPTVSINSTLNSDLAETLALECGCELEIKRPINREDVLLAERRKDDNVDELVPRAPIVTIMGHVDHGKTTLLDKIRLSNIVATEAGGITQVIRAWRVEHDGKPVTFLDTPGHQAFTKMRARGAQVTDIVVIVVAADDGVMPQTEEAINHAKAAGVQMVVAINKIDLPNANVNKARQQLYGLNVLPDNMGGDTPFVELSAATGKGIDELLVQLATVAELMELKAHPTKPAEGTCLEAMLSEGEGVQATLLVQGGLLRRGDVILCGAAFGRVRAMYDDLGRPIQEAGPSVPVRVTGLDEVPNADDPFLVVPDLAVAREIADKRKTRQQEASIVKRPTARLENLSDAKIAELKVILKADFRGSVEAIRKELEKLQHAEVRVRILEAAIGGITENDVWLALTSPEDTIIVGFNVVPDDRARALAEERGVQIREYDIIYQLTDDIRAALEGKLKPREDVIHLGRAVVRQTFKISRTGTIAGCYVTQGTIERSAKVRLIREGVVIYPPAERTASLDSLKHHKEDKKEVREGFECGLKIAGYDDIKVGDVIEAYRIEQVQRTLT